MTRRAPGASEDGLHFELFFALFAIAHLHHFEFDALLQGLVWEETASGLPVAVAALLLLWRPADVRRVATLAVLQFLDVAVTAPHVPNHWLITGLVNLTLLLAIAETGRKHRRWPTLSELFSNVLVPLQVGVALIYLYTGFWKLNADFLSPDLSCGAQAASRLAMQFGITGFKPILTAISIQGTLALELLGPPLLLWPRTRRFALVAFAVFHLVLAFDFATNLENFSLTMLPLLLLYVPAQALAVRRAGRELWPLTRVLHLVWCFVIVGTPFLFQPPGFFHYFARFALATVLVPMEVVLISSMASDQTRPTWPRALPVAWCFVMLVALNGLCPWLGFKNRNSFQMYSNLRLEADASNHLLLPQSLDLLGVLSDKVEILAISDQALAKEYVGTDLGLTWYSFRNELATRPDASVRYRRAGKLYTVARVGDDPELSKEYSMLRRKLSWYRPLGPSVAKVCVW